jgi:pyridoxal phosphate enzyme, yggS family
MPTRIAAALTRIRQTLPTDVTLLAVSKTHPAEAIQEAYDAGQRCFGENKVQELIAKAPLLPQDIEWHLIGHLQTNKVRSVLPYVSLIQSVDSLKLVATIDKESAKLALSTRILLQVHIAQEETKFGFSPEELRTLIEKNAFTSYKHVQICGLMGMASLSEDEAQIRREFDSLKALFNEIRAKNLLPVSPFQILSMGMSGDYPIAVEAGSTLVRVGSSIFGARNYGAEASENKEA